MPLPEVDFGPDIEEYASSTAPTSCHLSVKPGVSIFADFLMMQQGGCCRLSKSGDPTGMLRDCHIGSTSDHHEGRAFDWMISAYEPEENARAEEFLSWLLKTDQYGNEHANLRRLGITYVIWNGQSWSVLHRRWRRYTRQNQHVDHVHISFGWPGARGETSLQRWLAGELPAKALWQSPTARLLAGAALVLGAWFGYQYFYAYARA
jgi:hypothetical protein